MQAERQAVQMLKNKNFAWAVSALLILFSVFILGGNKLIAERNKAMDVFINGSNEDASSIHQELDKLSGYAKNLSVVAKNVISEDESAVNKLLDAAEALSKADTTKQKLQAYKKLLENTENVLNLCKAKEKSQQNADYLTSIEANIKTAAFKISNNSYNNAAIEANREMRGFPQMVIRLVRNIKPLELFE